MIRWEKAEEGQKISNLRGKFDRGEWQMQWDFQDAQGFLVVEKKYSNKDVFELRDLLEKKFDECIGSFRQKEWYSDEECSFFYITASRFLHMNNRYIPPQNHFIRGAVRYFVFACQWENDGLIIYGPHKLQEQSILKKVNVTIEIKEHRRWLGLGKSRLFTIKIPNIEGYEDYNLGYKRSDLPYLYPITREMLNQTIEVIVPGGENVEIRLSDQGKEIYQLR